MRGFRRVVTFAAMSRRILAGWFALLLVGAAVLVPAPATAAQASPTEPAAVDTVRFGGADRYATSLLVAEAVAADAGGSLDWVVMVSGRSWPDAVVAASIAGHLGAPVLMTPPTGVRDDALEFFETVGASNVLLVSTGPESTATIRTSVDEQLRAAGLEVERAEGTDQYATGIAVAKRLGTPGSHDDWGAVAIIASGEVFADALVAGPVSAHGRFPVLLNPKAALHDGVSEYLRTADIDRVLIMGGKAALSQQVEDSIKSLGIVVNRWSGPTRFETATAIARSAAAFGSDECFAGSRVGIARARVPFDSFSAAPLLARNCATLVLTEPNAVPSATSRYLDNVRSSRQTVTLSVFGGNAAVSQASLDAYLSTGTPDDDTDEPEADAEPAAIDCDGSSTDPPMRLLSSEQYARHAVWSPDCRHIAYHLFHAVWVMDADGSNPRKVTERLDRVALRPAWSPDGTKIAYTSTDIGLSDSLNDFRSYIYVVNVDGTDDTAITSGTVMDSEPAWSPDGSRIAFQRTTWEDLTTNPPVGFEQFIVTVDPDGRNPVVLEGGEHDENTPAWSPDGTKIAVGYFGGIAVMDADGTNLRTSPGTRYWSSALSWAPDGTRVAFSRIAGTFTALSNLETNIAILDVASGDVTDVTTATGPELNPSWSPDGQRILFNTNNYTNGESFIHVVGADHR